MAEETQFSIAELGAKFGAQLSQSYAEIITLEKRLAAQALTIQAMTANEAALVDHIQNLEIEVKILEADKKADERARMAADGRAIIQGRKEEAAP